MRLIDADALMREFADFVRASNNSDFANVPTWNDAVSLLGSAPTIEADPQKAYDQGVKDTADKYDEVCRIASEVRVGMGCNTAKECWELIRNGEIQRVQHGKWIRITKGCKGVYICNQCHRKIEYDWTPALITQYYPYCHCGAKMDEVEE